MTKKIKNMRKKRTNNRIRKAKGYSPNTRIKKLNSLKRQFATRKIQSAFRKDKCAICLERINKKMRNECHNFHDKCINSWIKRGNQSCPLCRIPIGLRRFEDVYDTEVLNRYNTIFCEYISELNELREEFNDIDPSYLEENSELNDDIDKYLEICQRFIRIIENQASVSSDLIEIMSNIESIKVNTNNLINDLKYDHLDRIQEIAAIRGYR